MGRVYPPSILLTSNPTHLPARSEEKYKARSQDVYCKSQPRWIFVCDELGQIIHQTSATSVSVVKTNCRQEPDPPPPPETIRYHEMYFWQTRKISFSHLPCPHLFLHCLRVHGDRRDEQHKWTPTPPPPPQFGKMTKTRGQAWRLTATEAVG